MTTYGAKEMAQAFRTVRGNTVQIAEEIPEDKYDFAAAPGTRSVRALLSHIAYICHLHYDFHRDKRVTTLKGYDFPALHARTRAMADVRRTKREIVSLLKDEGEQFASWLVSLTPDFLFETYTDPAGANPRTRFENLLSAKEHEMHHRGQLMLIQRMLGITPHLTRQADERNRARAATSSVQSTAR
ncbi:MAG TPA: DinB family protein [Gemmatimonadaceae bacterium]|nr:DinB family protein [Gemmatimonadaceae bacterium]